MMGRNTGMQTNMFSWLPDDYASVRTQEGIGPVSAVNQQTFLLNLRKAMDSGKATGILDWTRRTPDELDAQETDHWNGVLALALLAECLDRSFSIRVVEVRADAGRLAADLLHASGRRKLQVCFLCSGDRRAVLGILDPRWVILPVPEYAPVSELAGKSVPWLNTETMRFQDPVRLLTVRERDLLYKRLCSLHMDAVQSLKLKLEASLEKAEKQTLHEKISFWGKAWKACMAMRRMCPESLLQVQTVSGMHLPASEILEAYGYRETETEFPERNLYFWGEYAFAQSSALYGIELLPDPKASDALQACVLEEELLEKYSGGYRHVLAESLQEHLQTDTGLRPQVQQLMRQWQKQAVDSTALPLPALEMRYPWRTNSAALRLLLGERLGEEWAAAAMQPFSDRVLLLEGGRLGDEMTSRKLTIIHQNRVVQVVPPISPELTACQNQKGSEVNGIDWMQLHAEADDRGDIRFRMVLCGRNHSVVMTRAYKSMEQVFLSGDEIPEIRLWPNIPLAGHPWKAYFLSLRGRIGIRVWDTDTVRNAESRGTENDAGADSTLLRLGAFPYYLSLYRGAQSLGMMRLPAGAYEGARTDTAELFIAPGETEAGLAMRLNGKTEPIRMPCLQTVVMAGAEAASVQEPLPWFSVDGIVPAAGQIKNRSEPLTLFRDGWISGTESSGRYVLFRTDPAALAGRSILFQELILLAAFHAAMYGAATAYIHAVLPGSMEADEKHEYEQEMKQAADVIQEMTGMTLICRESLGTRAASACRHLFRLQQGQTCTSVCLSDTEWTAGVSVQGYESPFAEIRTGSAWNVRLLTELSRTPSLVKYELGCLPGFPYKQLQELISHAQEDPKAWEQSLAGIDLAFHNAMPETARVMNLAFTQGQMLYIHALWVLEVCKTLTMAGAATVESLYRSGTDLNGVLLIPVCVQGDREEMYAALDPALKYQAARFVQLAAEAARMNLRFTISCAGDGGTCEVMGADFDPEWETPVTDLSADGFEMEGLLIHFLMLFFAAFPVACLWLFPGRMMQSGVVMRTTQMEIHEMVQHMEGTYSEVFSQCLDALRMPYRNPEGQADVQDDG